MLDNGVDSVGFNPFPGAAAYPSLMWPGPMTSWWPNTDQLIFAMERTLPTVINWRTRGVRA